MAKNIALKTIKEWSEKTKGAPTNALRLYVGSYHVGNAYCIENAHVEQDQDVYNFHSHVEFISSEKEKTLDEIKDHIELSFKEFISKTIQLVY